MGLFKRCLIEWQADGGGRVAPFPQLRGEEVGWTGISFRCFLRLCVYCFVARYLRVTRDPSDLEVFQVVFVCSLLKYL